MHRQVIACTYVALLPLVLALQRLVRHDMVLCSVQCDTRVASCSRAVSCDINAVIIQVLYNTCIYALFLYCISERRATCDVELGVELLYPAEQLALCSD